MISSNKKIINNNWLYKDNVSTEYSIVNIPHTNKEVSYNYFDEKSYQFISDYKKTINITNSSKRIFLNFEGVMTAFKLNVNNNFVGEFKGGYIPHFIEITNFINFGQDNEVHLEVDSTERKDIPPYGYVIDYLTFGGIYRDVYLYELNNSFVEKILYDYSVSDINEEKGKVNLSSRVLINSNDDLNDFEVKFLIDNKEFKFSIKVDKGTNWYDLDSIVLDDINLWSIEKPNLYNLECELLKDGQIIDSNLTRIGFRELIIENNRMTLNGKNVKIFGLNRHQSFPYVGYAMPKRVQEKDADILKDELGLNLVRTSHYPQSTHFLNRCDEIGLLVLEEIPGWQNISVREDWREQVLRDVEEMILRDYNHPSIITWGVRINESWDDDALYIKTNELARRLDKNRKTCGIRCYEKSSFLEDIYTMNDFIHDGGEMVLRSRKQVTGLEEEVPYIVTEFCGHMYPTKKFDQEERLIEHALRHGRVHSKANELNEYLGAIGWCAFDYNTHYDFGSGDRICYHGVMDMFRLPKFAANLYRSQKNPKKEVIVEPLTYWTRGDRNGGSVFPIYVCTNCDEIELRFNGKAVGRFKRDDKTVLENLKNLKYPPIKVTGNGGEWGAAWSGAEFVGYVNGEEVGRKIYCADPIVSDIVVSIDDNELNGNEFDATRVVVKAVDENGNILPYSTGSISVETIGDIKIIGPKTISLIGGSTGFWVKTLGDFSNNLAKIVIISSFNIQKEIIMSIK